MGAEMAGWLFLSPVRSLQLGGTLRYLRVSILGRGDVRKYPSGRVPTECQLRVEEIKNRAPEAKKLKCLLLSISWSFHGQWHSLLLVNTIDNLNHLAICVYSKKCRMNYCIHSRKAKLMLTDNNVTKSHFGVITFKNGKNQKKVYPTPISLSLMRKCDVENMKVT